MRQTKRPQFINEDGEVVEVLSTYECEQVAEYISSSIELLEGTIEQEEQQFTEYLNSVYYRAALQRMFMNPED